MRILGIDPGLDGALVLYDTRRSVVVSATVMPTFVVTRGASSSRKAGTRRIIDGLGLATFFRAAAPIHHTFVERAQSSPQMGNASAFSYGEGYGIVKGCIYMQMLPVEFVPPAKWKKELKVPAAKDDARQRASDLLPKSAHWWTPSRGGCTTQQAGGLAEAALLCLYGEIWLTTRRSKKDVVSLDQ